MGTGVGAIIIEKDIQEILRYKLQTYALRFVRSVSPSHCVYAADSLRLANSEILFFVVRFLGCSSVFNSRESGLDVERHNFILIYFFGLVVVLQRMLQQNIILNLSGLF